MITSSKTQETPLGRQRSFGKARTPPQARRPDVLPQKNNVSAEATRQKTKLSDNVVADGAFDGSIVADVHGKTIENVTEGQAVAEKKLNHGTNELHAQRDDPRPFFSVSSHEQDSPQTEPLPPPRPPKMNIPSEAASLPENLMMSPLAKSASDPNLLNSHSDRKHVRVSRHNSHEDENWYLPGIPRLVRQFMVQTTVCKTIPNFLPQILVPMLVPAYTAFLLLLLPFLLHKKNTFPNQSVPGLLVVATATQSSATSAV